MPRIESYITARGRAGFVMLDTSPDWECVNVLYVTGWHRSHGPRFKCPVLSAFGKTREVIVNAVQQMRDAGNATYPVKPAWFWRTDGSLVFSMWQAIPYVQPTRLEDEYYSHPLERLSHMLLRSDFRPRFFYDPILDQPGDGLS